MNRVTNHTELPLKVRCWDGDQWPERRVSIANGDEHALFVSARYADIEKAELQAKEIVTAVNNYHRLRDQLIDCLELMEESERRYDQGQEAPNMNEEIKYTRALLDELDNMENGS